MANNNDKKYQAEWEALTIADLMSHDPHLIGKIASLSNNGPSDFRYMKLYLPKLKHESCASGMDLMNAMGKHGITVKDYISVCKQLHRLDIVRSIESKFTRPLPSANPSMDSANPGAPTGRPDPLRDELERVREENRKLSAMLADANARLKIAEERAKAAEEVRKPVHTGMRPIDEIDEPLFADLKTHKREYIEVIGLLATNNMFREVATLCRIENYVRDAWDLVDNIETRGLKLETVKSAINDVALSKCDPDTLDAIEKINATFSKLSM